MGKVDHLSNRVEPFGCPVLGAWQCTVLVHKYLTLPAGTHHSTGIHKACLHMVMAGSFIN